MYYTLRLPQIVRGVQSIFIELVQRGSESHVVPVQ